MIKNIAGMNITYLRYTFDMFLASMNKLGISFIELWGGAPHFYIEDLTHQKTMEIYKTIKDHELDVICFTPEQCMYPINLAAQDDVTGKRSLQYFTKCINVCNTLEVSKMVVTTGFGYYDKKVDEGWKYSQERLYQLSKTAEAKGVYLALEPLSYFETNIVKDLRTLKKMIYEINSPMLKPMVDTVPMFMENESLEQYFTEFGKDLIHIHLVDSTRGSYDHLAWGDGTLPLQNYLTTIMKNKYDGYLTLELIGPQYALDPQSAMKKSIEFIVGENANII